MRPFNRAIFLCAVAFFLLIAGKSAGQFSLSITAGLASNGDGDDRWALNTQWPPAPGGSSTSGGDNNNSLVFFSKGTGTSLLITATYDVSPIFSIGLAYRSLSFTMTDNKRTGTITSIGILPRLNFVKNTARVVPFFQTEFYFKNSSNASQTAATSTKYPAQIQPGFSEKSTSNLGIGGDLGIEITILPPLHIILSGGFHGVEVGGSGSALNTTVKNLSYPAAYDHPQGFDGTFFYQYAAGLKYYFGKGKKKRDF